MWKYTVEVNGMMCGMCEAHVSDAIRGALPVKKVTASHTKGQAVILSEAPLDEEALRQIAQDQALFAEEPAEAKTQGRAVEEEPPDEAADGGGRKYAALITLLAMVLLILLLRFR